MQKFCGLTADLEGKGEVLKENRVKGGIEDFFAF